MRLLDWLRHRGMVGDGSTDHYLRGDMTWNTPPGITGSGNASEYLNGNLAWTVPSGGGTAGDMLSVLTSSEVSVTGATTATISKMHVCSGTSADYTVTLPAASGNTGKFIGFRMATGLTKLVTLDGDTSETIDGATTRVMWAGETAILLCDGSNWFKVAGRSKPMAADIGSSGTQTLTSGSEQQVTTPNTSNLDNTGMMVDTTNHLLTIKRTGNYQVSHVTLVTAGANTGTLLYAATKVGSTYISTGYGHCGIAGGYIGLNAVRQYAMTAGDQVKLYASQNTGANCTITSDSKIIAVEQPAW